MAPAWLTTKSVYGPVFTGASAGLAQARAARRLGEDPHLGCSTASRPPPGCSRWSLSPPWWPNRCPAFAVAFVGWNPLLAIDFAGGGHNDVWMMVLVLGAPALAARAPALSSYRAGPRGGRRVGRARAAAA